MLIIEYSTMNGNSSIIQNILDEKFAASKHSKHLLFIKTMK